jgi:hypothetical protein
MTATEIKSRFDPEADDLIAGMRHDLKRREDWLYGAFVLGIVVLAFGIGLLLGAR